MFHLKTKYMKSTNVQPTTKPAIVGNNVLAAGVFSKLGLRQKHIIKQIVVNDYFILKTLDTRDMSVTITLIDDADNHDRDLTEKELQALWGRGFLLNKDVSMCLELIQEKFYLNEKFADEAMNACC